MDALLSDFNKLIRHSSENINLKPETGKRNEEEKNNDTKWRFLEHKGPLFAPPYEPLPPSVKFYYDGEEIELSQSTEEWATHYSRLLDDDYITKKPFNENFFHDWRKVMTVQEKSIIKELSKCNFTEMHDFLNESAKSKAISDEQKKAIKDKEMSIQKEYGFCTIDGRREKIKNYNIEPPDLFKPQGDNLKMGKLKKRIYPEDVVINCSEDSNIPKAPQGHNWKNVVHNPNVSWLASWMDPIQNHLKYIELDPSSKLKGKNDWQKYETARKLAKSIEKIRQKYREDWMSREMPTRQIAVALYFIDKLALRAGNKKNEDQTGTVGCCSLRVKHIKLYDKKGDKDYVVVLDFLGKHSIPYYNEISVEKTVFENLTLFREKKELSDYLFDELSTIAFYKYLNQLMEGLTAKVFRTYIASWTFQQQLEQLTNRNDTVANKINSYNKANLAVAKLCNHQRSSNTPTTSPLKVQIEEKKNSILTHEAKRDSINKEADYDKEMKALQDEMCKLEIKANDREENNKFLLVSSKLHYIDPRISVAWCKKNNVGIEKIFSKSQRDKFKWAIEEATAEYVF